MKRKRGSRRTNKKGKKRKEPTAPADDLGRKLVDLNTEDNSGLDALNSAIDIDVLSHGHDLPSKVSDMNGGGLNDKPVGRGKGKLRTSKTLETHHTHSNTQTQSDTEKAVSEEHGEFLENMEDAAISLPAKQVSVSEEVSKKPGTRKNKSSKGLGSSSAINVDKHINRPNSPVQIPADRNHVLIDKEKAVDSSTSREMHKESSLPDQDRQYNENEPSTALEVIKKIMKMDAAKPFNAPVNPVALGIPVTVMNRGKRSRHACVVAAALATPAQLQVTQSSRAESTPEGAAQATLAQPQVTRSSRAESTPEGAAEATPVQPQVTRSSRADSMPEGGTNARPMDPIGIVVSSGQPDQVLSPHTPSSSVASALDEGSRRVRGRTRGLKVQKLRRQLGHAIPISIPASSHAPEGKFATAFANLLGEVIRDEAPVRKEGWKFVPEGIKKLVVKRVQLTFEFGDYVNDPIIKAAVDAKCQKLYREWKCNLHTHYLSLLEAGVPDPKSHPLKPCKADDWAWMIDNLWETMEWKEKSKKARVSRSKMPWNHTSGSRSFLARSSIIRAQNAGNAQPFPDFYHDTHYMHGKKKWINEEAQKTHEELVRVSAEQSQPSITSPMTEEQVSVQVLGHRSGYLKGFGIRTKSTLASTHNQTGPDSEVLQLRQQVAEFSQRTIFLEGLVRQLAQRAGIDPNMAVGADGTSSGAQDATSLGLNEN